MSLSKLHEKEAEKSLNIIKDSTIHSFVNYLKEKEKEKGCPLRIVVMTGAGVSTASGIPDFRSPGTGLYANLQKYNLPFAEAIFELDYFLRNPDPFYELSRELFPGSYKPTHSHHFIRLLEERNWLLRNYSQNIDMLERIANVSDDKIVEAHGSFHTASCVGSAIKHADPNQDDTKGSKDDSDDDDDDGGRIERIPGCGKKYSLEEFKTLIFNKDKGGIPRCDACSGLIKPDIVFFGEQLPDRFHSLIGKDFRDADALIVMGTSLQVMPFASLINSVRKNVPRLLINMEEVGVRFSSSHGFDFSGRFQKYRRDAFYKGTTDEGVKLFCKLMGEDWCDSLEKLVAAKDAKVDNLGLKKEEEVVLDKAAEDDLTSAFSNVKL